MISKYVGTYHRYVCNHSDDTSQKRINQKGVAGPFVAAETTHKVILSTILYYPSRNACWNAIMTI